MAKKITLQNLHSDALLPGLSYNDGMIALIENPRDLYPNQAVQVDSTVLTLCIRGTIGIKLNGKAYTLKANDLVVCWPHTIIDYVNPDAEASARGIIMARAYSDQLFTLTGNHWDTRLFLEHHPVLNLTAEEASLFLQYYDLLHTKLTHPQRRHHRELAHALLTAFLYDFCDTAERITDIQPSSFTSGERLFKAFTDLIADTHPRPRNVAWYADRLNVTPKYLSTVVKEKSGEPASALIQRYIVADIVYRLRHTPQSNKEIANELGFPNLSFFGKYVRHHLGLSPKQFRQAGNKE